VGIRIKELKTASSVTSNEKKRIPPKMTKIHVFGEMLGEQTISEMARESG